MDTARFQNNMLFAGMSAGDIEKAFAALNGRIRKYDKGETVLCAGTPTDTMGLVLSGSVTIENNDVWGNRTILSIVHTNGFFAETYAFLGNEPVSVDVTANEPSEIAFFRVHRLMKEHPSPELWESRMLRGILKISMHKNLLLSRRSFHISPKSVRGRIMSYLDTVSTQKHSGEFDIPFDRQQLADYLNVDRTALSKELGRMRDEGIIEFKKNHFVLKGDCQ